MKKRLALLLAFIMLTGSLFAGCAKKTSNSDSVTLKWYVPGDNYPGLGEVLAAANKITEKRIGVKLDLQFIDTGAYDERMRMMMSSGAKYDLCFTGYINKYVKAAQMGGLEPLDELLKSTPDLVKAIPEFFWDGAKVDGVIYAVPNQQVVSAYPAPAIPTRLVEKYGLAPEAVTSYEELEPFLEAVKNGEEGIYPWRNYNAFFSVGCEFEELSNGFAIRRGDKKCKVVFTDEQPEWIEGMKVRNSWFNKGYIRPDVVSVGDDSTDYLAGKYAVSMTNYKPGAEINLQNTLGEPVTMLKNISKPYVKQAYITAALTGISRTSEHKEEAIKLIELINTDADYCNLICFGIEGKHYTKDKNGTISFIKNSTYKPDAAWKFGNQFNAYVNEGMEADVWEQTEKMNNDAETSPLLGFNLDTANIETELSQCETIRRQYGYAFFMGAQKVDSKYDEYLKRMKEAGSEKIIKEIQGQVNEFLKNK